MKLKIKTTKKVKSQFFERINNTGKTRKKRGRHKLSYLKCKDDFVTGSMRTGRITQTLSTQCPKS